MSATPQEKAAAFFKQFRRQLRGSQEQTGEEETPPKASTIIQSAISPLTSLQAGRAKSPTSANAETSPRMAPRAPPSASKPPHDITSSSGMSHGKKSTRDRLDEDEPDPSSEPSTDEPSSVRDQILTEQPALWDPPFAPTPSAPGQAPAQPINPRRSRGARRSSPILNAQIDDKDKKEDANAVEQASEDKQAGAKGAADKKYSLTSIVAHRPKPGEPNLFQLLVRWAPQADSPVETWEPEENLHDDAPRALFEYWRRVGGREEHMQDPTLWYVEGVKKHQVARGRVLLSVSWVGSPDVNWEPEGRVVDIAPTVVEDYWEAQGGREACVSGKKRKGAAKKGGAKRVRKS